MQIVPEVKMQKQFRPIEGCCTGFVMLNFLNIMDLSEGIGQLGSGDGSDEVGLISFF
jgi:hypothetical protein